MESVTKAVSGGYSGLISMLQQNGPLLVVFSVLYITILKQDTSTREAILNLEHKMDMRFLHMHSEMNDKFLKIELKLNDIDNRVKSCENRLGQLEIRMEKLDTRMDDLDTRMSKLEK